MRTRIPVGLRPPPPRPSSSPTPPPSHPTPVPNFCSKCTTPPSWRHVFQMTHRHSAPGHSAFGHSAPGHSAPRTLRSQDIQLPGHSGLLDIQVFRTLRSQDIQLPGHSGLLDIQLFWTSRSFGHPALLDIQVFWTSRSFGHPGLSDFQFLFLIVKMLVMSVEYICWYWIYHANTWGMNVSWRVSVCPSGTGLGNVYF